MHQNWQKSQAKAQGWEKGKGYSIPLTKKFYPPGQVFSELHINMYQMRIIAETGQ